jgi:hypothetical protein
MSKSSVPEPYWLVASSGPQKEAEEIKQEVGGENDWHTQWAPTMMKKQGFMPLADDTSHSGAAADMRIW